MDTSRLIRPALLAAALFNLGAALAFAFPATLGQVAGLPPAPPLYAALVAVFVLLFGASYFWAAWQAVIPKHLVAFGAVGKTSAAVLFFSLWLAGQASLLLMLGGLGDLAFAALFFSWLRSQRG